MRACLLTFFRAPLSPGWHIQLIDDYTSLNMNNKGAVVGRRCGLIWNKSTRVRWRSRSTSSCSSAKGWRQRCKRSMRANWKCKLSRLCKPPNVQTSEQCRRVYGELVCSQSHSSSWVVGGPGGWMIAVLPSYDVKGAAESGL